MRALKIVSCAVVAIALSGCIFDFYRRSLDDDYALLSIDGRDDFSLCAIVDGECQHLVSGAVVAWARKGDVSVAIRLPYNIDGPAPGAYQRESVLEYYVINRTGTGRGHDVLGPYTEADFREEAKRRALPEPLALPF
ncbi:hypothetical protein [Brevundimonas sp.]|jgi:hypothetical protein|uniref:hypothetical protein n=1 Tax=Brevundimonas sp. TaxID=1871086 RepID=UPI002E0FD6C1|nr:hypothetical protein [Brevundimonas sp.]